MADIWSLCYYHYIIISKTGIAQKSDMYKYVQCRQPSYVSQILSIQYGGRQYYPHVLHTTLDLDRPTGEKSTYGEHIHNVYHIVFYTHAHGRYTKNGITHEALPGTLAIISPGEPHDFYRLRSGAVYSEVTLVYETSEQNNLTLKFDDLLSYYVGHKIYLRNDEDRLSEQLVREFRLYIVELMDYLQSNSTLSEFNVYRILLQIFGFVITNFCSVENEHPDENNYNLQQVKHYIDSHYDTPLTISQLADQSMMSRGHFFREFRAIYGISPIAHQQSVRIEAAKNLLRATNMHCNEIARRVGYENVSLFHRIFKNKIGLSPSQYRAAQIKNGSSV